MRRYVLAQETVDMALSAITVTDTYHRLHGLIRTIAAAKAVDLFILDSKIVQRQMYKPIRWEINKKKLKRYIVGYNTPLPTSSVGAP